MKTSRILALAAGVLALAAGLLVLLRSDDSAPRADVLRPGGPALPRAAEPGGPAALLEEAEAQATPGTPAAVPATKIVPGTAASDRAAVSDGLRRVLVRVSMPPETPADPSLVCWALPASFAMGGSPQDLIQRLRTGERPPATRTSARVDADGTAELTLPADLETPLLVLDGRFLYQDEPVSVPAGASEVRLAPNLGACIVARLEGPAGDALSGDIILTGGSFAARRGGGWQRREREVETGELVFRGLDPSLAWTLIPRLEEHDAPPHIGLELEPGQELVLGLEATRGVLVRGEVVDEAGAPLAGVRVRTTGGSPWFGGADEREAETDASGSFELPGVTPGDIVVEASRQGWREVESEELQGAVGDVVDGVRLVLDRGLSIAGAVRFADGRDAPQARVFVEARRRGGWGQWGGSRSERVGEATADDAGRFEVSGLAEGLYTLRATSADGEDGPTWRAGLEGVQAGTTDVALSLAAPIGFSGVVVDDRSEPVTEFELRLRAADETGPRLSERYDDAEGRFRFEQAGPGTWSVAAEAAYHDQEDELEIQLPGAGAEVRIVLRRAASITGRVVDAGGRPLPGAYVQTDDGSRAMGGWGGPSGPGMETDAEGAFELLDVPARGLTLVASANGQADSEPIALDPDPGEELADIVLTLRDGGRITGAVLTPEGDPVAARRVTWGENAMGFGSRGETTTDQSGRFEFAHVTPGDWAVSAAPSMAEMGERMRGRRDESAFVEVMGELVTETVTVVDGETVEVFLGGEPRFPVRLFGTVTRAGEPLPGAQVYAVSEGSSIFQGMKTATVEDDGSYALVVDRPGSYVVSARSEEIGVEATVDVKRKEEQRVDLAVPLGRITGTVRKPDGSLAVGVRLGIQREDGLGRMRWNGSQKTTDERARYAFEDLEAGRYTLRANVSNWSGRFDERWGTSVLAGVRVGVDASTDRVDFRLQEAGAVEGLVVGADGAPLAGASVFFRDADGRMVSQVSGTMTDAAGAFRRQGLEPGDYTVSARADGLASAEEVRVSVRSDETAAARVTVDTGTLLVVTVSEEETGDLRRARVEVLDAAGNEVGGLVTLETIRSAFNEGSSSLESRLGPLPPGRYTVRATLPDGRVEEKRVRLRGRGGEKTVKLELEG